MANKVGRPVVGVPKKTAESYSDCLNDWIQKRLLVRWLKDYDRDVQAIEAYDQLDFLAVDKHEHLTIWCQTWLTDDGWKRLQANARQKRYKKKEMQLGPKFKRVSMKRDAAIDLEEYAKSRDITITDAVRFLLKNAGSQR
nr:hypothetical protein [Endozoicomonas sp.]